MLDARLLGCGVQFLGLGERGGNRLFAIDVLAGGDGALDQLGAQLSGRGVEEHRVVLVLEGTLEVGGPALDAVLLRQLFDLRGVAADEDRVGHQALAVFQRHAALLANLEDGSDQVLVHAHAPGDAVHDDADALHAISFIAFQSGSAALANPGPFRLLMPISPSLIFSRTAPWLRSYKSG